MRRTKPPVGWERAKNCFPVPNELLDFDLPAGAVAVYICLLRHANRKTNQCHPSEAIIAKKLHLSRITKQGVKRNGNLLYTLLPIHEVTERFYERQLCALDKSATRSRVQARLVRQPDA